MELFPDKSYEQVVAGLRATGYQDDLLQENYTFVDWFSPTTPLREVPAVAFAQTPVSYDSAVIGVVCANGLREQALIDQHRALCAPIILEIDTHEIREWAVSAQAGRHEILDKYPIDKAHEIFIEHAQTWHPPTLLRTKNLGAFRWTYQLGLFAGLLPELEEQIQAKLEPLLKEAVSVTKAAYLEDTGRQADEAQLFKLVFWLLTAKVFHDRRVPTFITVGPDPDELLQAIARHYKTQLPRFLTRHAREVAASFVWSILDFRHLSVEALSQLWANFLLDKELRRNLGIYRTSRTIVRYIVEKIPFTHYGDDERIIFEPCSGSAGFLIGAMNALRPRMYGMSASQRHQYFRRHLAAMENESLGIEISRLALTLADFPNPNSWEIAPRDVYEPGAMTDYLKRAGVVLCNPPFGEFKESERKKYQVQSPYRAVEMISRVLRDLHSSGVIGFVLPRALLDGQSYKEVRKQLTTRFASLDVTVLPDRAFEKASTEVCLVVGTEPIPHKACRLVYSKVNDSAQDWWRFALRHETSLKHEAEFHASEAEKRLSVPDLPEVWEALVANPTLSEHADLSRGIEWNKPLVDKKHHNRETGFRAEVVRDNWDEEYFKPGIAPKTKFKVFETPKIMGLRLHPDDERGNSYDAAWENPKVIINKAGRSRGPWRISAFPDTKGLAFYQTFIGVWPKSQKYDIWILAAVLNSPLANAFVASREGKTDITFETLELIPLPYLTHEQTTRIRELAAEYRRATTPGWGPIEGRDPSRILMEIDATVLDGYRLTPRLENQLLNFFRGRNSKRPTSHYFGDYLPPDCEAYFSLSDHLSPRLKEATIGQLLKRSGLE